MRRLVLRLAWVACAATTVWVQLWAQLWAQDASTTALSAPDLGALSIEELMQVKVQGAALHPQTLRDAPASVTIITAEDIRKYGYRTLGEALSYVRGFYVSNDRNYESLGVRGFNLPGDYSSHVLVMVNGHNMVDSIFNYMLYFGNDFPIEMSLIKQIEIIRGPGSALYGSSAMFATINIITKTPEEVGPASATTTFDSFGEKKVQLATAAALGGAKVLLSGSLFNNSGESPLYFQEFNSPLTNYGNAVNMTGEKGYHFFSTLAWRNWTVTAAFSGDSKIQPISWGPTIFNDPGSRNEDLRNYIDAAYQREIAGGTLLWRTYYDSFHYKGIGDYALTSGAVEENQQNELGDWVGTKLTYRLRPSFAGDITLGAETNVDIRARSMDFDVSPAPVTYLNASHLDRSIALLLQDEKKLSSRWALDVGLRVDKSAIHPDFASPRAALIYQRPAWTYKFLYGRSFLNPSVFQLFYGDGVADAANPGLRPESADTLEVDVERKLGKRMTFQAAAYGYRLHHAIEGVYLPNGLLQYQNGLAILAQGIELEVSGHPLNWLETTASFAVQEARDDGMLENSPEYLGKLRFAVPAGHKLAFSSGMQYMSSRPTLAGATVGGLYIADMTLTSRHLLRGFDFTFGVRNAFHERYSDPIALNPVVDIMPQPGRSVFVELLPHRER